MFGSKSEKLLRLQRELDAIIAHGPMVPAELARVTGINRNQVLRDLADLEKFGHRLQEDEYGHVSIADD